MYRNTLTKVQLILRHIDNSEIGYFANRIHDTSNCIGPTNVGPDTYIYIWDSFRENVTLL